MTEHKTDEGERLVKLALYIKAHAPVEFVQIRRGLYEYAFYEGNDPDEQRKHEQRVRRMFERDKTTLGSCGLVIMADGNNCYSIDASSSYAAPVDLTPAEASLLRLVCAARLEDDSYPLKSQLRMVLAKIGDELEVPDMLPGVATGKSADREPAGLSKIQKAISERKTLTFEYKNAKGQASARSVEPFGCFFFHKRCYVVAFDPHAPGGGGERMFRLDRMARVKVAAGTSPDFESRPFDVREWHKLPFQFGTDEFEATVLFGEKSAWRAESLTAGFGSLEDGEQMLWHVAASNADALASWCIEHGPDVVPVEPPQARAAYYAGLERALAVSGGAR